MPEKDYKSVTLPEKTIEEIDDLQDDPGNDFTSRPDVIKTAIRFYKRFPNQKEVVKA